MSIEKLKAELQKMQSFDEGTLLEKVNTAVTCTKQINVPTADTFAWWVSTYDAMRLGIDMARWQHAKSARTAQMLLSAVEALEFYADGNSWYRPEPTESGHFLCSRLPKDSTENGVGTRRLAGHIARETLTKLAKGAE